LASLNGKGLEVFKSLGAVDQHRDEAHVGGTIGIGHTRWATVGGVSERNAHPHLDCTGKVAVVHNGDIDNYLTLKESLIAEGHCFASDTDSEVIAHLIEKHAALGTVGAVQRTIQDLQGCYALVVLDQQSRQLVAARHESPLVLGLGENEVFVASDAPAILPYTNRIMYPQDGDVILLDQGKAEVWNRGEPVQRPVHTLEWDARRIEKNGYAHFMLKEIWEQPQVLRDTLAASDREMLALPMGRPSEALLLGCGTSFHAALMGEHLLSRFTGAPASARVASEFSGARPSSGSSLAVALSQSGETADTLAALRTVKALGYRTVGVTNVQESSIARMAQATVQTHAGPEVAVAATKTFLAQLMSLYLLAAHLAEDSAAAHRVQNAIAHAPDLVQRTLNMDAQLQQAGERLAAFDHLFIIAKGWNMPIAMEGALKFKEVAYLHAEGSAAGELKHGPFALLGADTPVIALLARDEHWTRMMTAIKEIKARGSPVLVLTDDPTEEVSAVADLTLTLPAAGDALVSPFANTVALQLMSYYCALARGCPIDRPRNLAKSVTVP
jgi:glucosamine--fructose-6-phosphate aminotransferase (isomerizing)